MAAAQSKATKSVAPVTAVQLAFDLGDEPGETEATGLPDMSDGERVRAELEILGLDVSRHVVDFYSPLLDALSVTRSKEMLHRRSRAQLLVAGVKVATQTPPIRSGRRVIFLTLDDGTGPVDATFFEDAQGPYAATLFHSWLLVVRGELRRTGPRGVSLRATGCWELPMLFEVWKARGMSGVQAVLHEVPEGFAAVGEVAVHGAAESRSTRPVMAGPSSFESHRGSGSATEAAGNGMTAGGMGRRRVLVHPSGYKQSPYSDIKPAGEDTKTAPRKLWHSSPGSSGR
jgi:error-prone DNA polymerase